MIYKTLIDPLLKGLHRQVVSLAPPGQRILDIACGHGTLAMMLALVKGCEVTGIDLEASKISKATEEARKKTLSNLNFLVMDATDLSPFGDKAFDVALTSMAIHQFSPEAGLKVMMEMKRVARTIIIADYAWPMPGNFYGWLARSIEWMARGEHHRNFLQYMKNGGLEPLLDRAGIKMTGSHPQGKGTMAITSGICE